MPQEESSITPLEEPQAPSSTIDTPSSAPAAEAPPTPASQDEQSPATEVVKADPPPEADPPKPSAREKLIAKLTGVGEEPEPESPEAEPPTPEPKAEGTEQPKAEKPPEAPPEDEKEVTNEEIARMKPGEARRKINRLLQKNREAAPLVGMAKEIIETCEKNGMTPADYKAWVALGLGLQAGHPQALEHFKQLADRAGITAAPAGMTPEFEAKLTELEENVDVSPKAARQLRALFGAKAPAKAPTPAPAPAPAPAKAPQNPNTPSPEQQAVQQRQQAGYSEMLQVGERYQKQIGEDRWKEIQPALAAALKARGAKAPEAWGPVYEAEINKLIAAAPRPAQVGTQLRPGTSPTASAAPQFKSERERVIANYSG